MKILRAYKTELDPTRKQVEALLQHAGSARWAYNWGLRRKIEAYKATGKTPTAIDLHRELNLLKKLPVEGGGVPWMYESSKCAPQEALRNLDAAFKGFFRRCRSGAKRKGFPRFKSKKRGIGSFRLTENKQAPASRSRRGSTTLKQSILFRSVLVFHILPKDLDRCSTCRDDAVARGPQHGLAPISSAQCWKLRTQTPRCNGLEVVDEVRWSHTRRHVQQSVDMIGLTRALQECFPPPTRHTSR